MTATPDDPYRLLPHPQGASVHLPAICSLFSVVLLVAGVLLLRSPVTGDALSAWIYAGILAVTAGVSGRQWWMGWRADTAARPAASALGLEFRPRVRVGWLRPFQQFPLFHLGSERIRRAGRLVEGRYDGFEVMLFLYDYRVVWEGAGGGARVLRATHTVLIVSDVGRLPEFHLSPRDNPWNESFPGWPVTLDVGEVVRVIAALSGVSILRGHQPNRLNDLFRRECLDQVKPLAGWTIESCGCHLLLYRHRWTAPPEDYRGFLDAAVGLARGLRTHCSGPEESGADEPRVRPLT